MAWLFAFVLSPIVGGIKRYLPAAPRSLVVVTVYAMLFLVLSGIIARHRQRSWRTPS